jgi:hypothetical protein
VLNICSSHPLYDKPPSIILVNIYGLMIIYIRCRDPSNQILFLVLLTSHKCLLSTNVQMLVQMFGSKLNLYTYHGCNNHRRNCRGWLGLGSISLLSCCMTRTKRTLLIRFAKFRRKGFTCLVILPCAGSVCGKSRFCLMWSCMYTHISLRVCWEVSTLSFKISMWTLGVQRNIWPAREVQDSILSTAACCNFSLQK